MLLADRIQKVRENIRAAAKASGRTESEVKLVAVTKTQPVAAVNEAISLGITAIGENKPQELASKLPYLLPCEKHMIGHLQSNKVKLIAGSAVLVHSLDRISLAEQLNARAKELDIVCDCLVQVNIGKEPQKGGVLPLDVLSFIERLNIYDNICVKGLMIIPPVCGESEAKRYFESLLMIKNEVNEKQVYRWNLTELSMGMSADYEAAIQNGATIVRIGTAIFGERVSQ